MGLATQAERTKARTLRRLIDRLDGLPSVPVVAQKVAEMVHDPRQDARSIAQVMKADPALSAKVLKIVNSPYYGIPGGVSDVTRAISFLGFSTIHELVLTVSVFDVFKDKRSSMSQALFRHSLAVAGASEAIAQIIGHEAPPECFTAGLLHDLGRLAILQLDGALEEGSESDELHEAVGDRLAARWRFPVSLRAAIAHHHETKLEHRDKVAKHLHSTVDVVGLADVICKRQGYGITEPEEEPVLPADVLERLNVLDNIETTAHDRLRWNLERSEVLMRILVGDA